MANSHHLVSLFFFFFHVYKRIYLGNTYNVANSHHLVSHIFFLNYTSISILGIPTMWRTVITWFPIFFLTIQAYLFREYLQCGEQSSPGFPFFFFFFFFFFFREYLQCGEHDLVFFYTCTANSTWHFFFLFFLTIIYMIVQSNLPVGVIQEEIERKKKLSAKGR